jgi:hypothetical protein
VKVTTPGLIFMVQNTKTTLIVVSIVIFVLGLLPNTKTTFLLVSVLKFVLGSWSEV